MKFKTKVILQPALGLAIGVDKKTFHILILCVMISIEWS